MPSVDASGLNNDKFQLNLGVLGSLYVYFMLSNGGWTELRGNIYSIFRRWGAKLAICWTYSVTEKGHRSILC